MSQQSKTHNSECWMRIWQWVIFIFMVAWMVCAIAEWETARFLAVRFAALSLLCLGITTLERFKHPLRMGTSIHSVWWFLGLGVVFGCLSNSCDRVGGMSSYQRCINNEPVLFCSQYIETHEDIDALHEKYSNESWLKDTEMTERETPMTDTHDEVMVFVKDNKEQWALGFASVANQYIRIHDHYFAPDDVAIHTIQNIGINKHQYDALPSSYIWGVGSFGGVGFVFLLFYLQAKITDYVLKHANEPIERSYSKMWFQVQFVIQILREILGLMILLMSMIAFMMIFSAQILVGFEHLLASTKIPSDLTDILDPSIFQLSLVVLFAYFILGYVVDTLQILYMPEFTLTQVMKRFQDSYPLSKEGIPQIPKPYGILEEQVLLFLSVEHIQVLRKIKADPSTSVLFTLGYRKYFSPEVGSPLSLASGTHEIQSKLNVANDDIKMWDFSHQKLLSSPFWPWCSLAYSHPSFTFELKKSKGKSNKPTPPQIERVARDAKRKEALDTEIARVVEKNRDILTLISTMEQTGLLKVHPNYFEITSYAERLLLYPDIHFDKNIPFWVYRDLAKIHAGIFSTTDSPYDGTLTSKLSELLERYLKEKIVLLLGKANIEDVLPHYKTMLLRIRRDGKFKVLDFTSRLSSTIRETIQEKIRDFLILKDPLFFEHPKQQDLIKQTMLMLPMFKIGSNHPLTRSEMDEHLIQVGFAPDVTSALLGSQKKVNTLNIYNGIDLSLSMEREWLTAWLQAWIDEPLSEGTLGALQGVLQGLLKGYGASDNSIKSLEHMRKSLQPVFDLVRDKRNQQSHHQVSDNLKSNTDFYDSFEYFSLAKTFIYAVAELEKQVTR